MWQNNPLEKSQSTLTWAASNVSWLELALLITIKVFEYNFGPFEHTQNMSKRLAGLVYVGNIFNYLSYFPNHFSRGLEVEL